MARKQVVGEEVADKGELMGGSLDRDTEVARQSEAIRAAIEAGTIIAKIDEVSRKVEGKQYRKEYLKLIPTSLPGALAIAGGVETSWKEADKEGEDGYFDGPSLLKDYFYGNDLGAKSKESQKLAVLVEGPDKAKMAAAKQLAKAYNISESEALAKIEAMGL